MPDTDCIAIRPTEAGNLYKGDVLLLAGDVFATVQRASWVPSDNRADVCEIDLNGRTIVCLLSDTFDKVVPAWEADID